MQLAYSADGTPIAYDKVGTGPPVILVDGALCGRSFGPMPKLAPRLAEHFTVFNYDRRGRGDSGDRQPYAVEREVQDLEALVREAGGSAQVCGFSSGAALSLEAAKRCAGITRLALYEAPWILDDAHAPLPADFLPRLKQLVAEERRGDAIKMFMNLVGVPGAMVAIMRLTPVWPKLKAVAHTLPNDIALIEPHQQGLSLAPGELADVTVPVLVLAGGKAPEWMSHSMEELAQALPHAAHRVLEGQTHNVKLKVIAPVVKEFFASTLHVSAFEEPQERVRA
jgi:pimeloyl-ACP methyl ester carboxylesterase